MMAFRMISELSKKHLLCTLLIFRELQEVFLKPFWGEIFAEVFFVFNWVLIIILIFCTFWETEMRMLPLCGHFFIYLSYKIIVLCTNCTQVAIFSFKSWWHVARVWANQCELTKYEEAFSLAAIGPYILCRLTNFC